MKTSHKKNRPFDFKLIDLVEPHSVLYQRHTGLSAYETMKTKNLLWEDISQQMGVNVQFCIMRWSNLRGQYQKELRHCRELCPKEGVIRGSTWPYLDRLSFLESTLQFNRPKRIRIGKRKLKQMEADKKRREATQPTQTSPPAYNSLDDAMECHVLMSRSDEMVEFIGNDEDFYIIEEPEDEDIIEETIPLEVATPEAPPPDLHMVVSADLEPPISSDDKLVSSGMSSAENLQRMSTALAGLDAHSLPRIERRIMAFLCKCQLRALTGDDVDDLNI